MKKALRIVLVLVVLALAGLLIGRHLGVTEGQRVQKQIAKLAERISKRAGESTTSMTVKIHGFHDLFADKFTVELHEFPLNGTYQQAEIASHMARVRPQFKSIALSFHDIHVVLEGENAALVTLTGRLVVVLSHGNERHEDTREVVCRMKKGEDHWRFMAFEEATVLER